MLQATPHFVPLVARVLGHTLTVLQIRQIVHLQTEGAVPGGGGVDEVHIALEYSETSAFICDSVVHHSKSGPELIPHQILVWSS